MSLKADLDATCSELIAGGSHEIDGAIALADNELVKHPIEQLHQHRILCVDDEILGTRMRAQILREHGYSVVVHHSPLSVLCCDLFIFNLAILDFQMPELNGKDLLLRMRALGVKFPILLLTGRLEALSYEDRVLFARCIDKAAPVDRLLDTIAEFLNPNELPDYGL